MGASLYTYGPVGGLYNCRVSACKVPLPRQHHPRRPGVCLPRGGRRFKIEARLAGPIPKVFSLRVGGFRLLHENDIGLCPTDKGLSRLPRCHICGHEDDVLIPGASAPILGMSGVALPICSVRNAAEHLRPCRRRTSSALWAAAPARPSR